ncbi:mobilization protein (plasmid) [Rhizobium ruizarguesonis]|uniref:mobilization protein n=1 Tax=Rhizobium ruizarguesonis TaxID=2081791 RepID=UPI00102FCAA9|nr:mobilization protein [Rhizobium ruizarguesonis]TAT95968.1 mobilization protein [Rhizobium ruizarguesonis]TAU15799.1 mobilization protein [Rhizobium ruizarguesonis]TAV87702.1 mobilization protein [Rhizobium ruizarguesonis]TAW13150.1 mobilization protein [Rhizobium ruizarguesonis]TAX68300.1 mobilization protein [Rhizobium ruizarguesonis]
MAVARKTIGERLAQLEAQRKTLQIRLGKQERAIDTRRKVLIGALVLHRLENDHDVQIGGGLAEWLRRELPKFLTRDGDRDLFDDLLKPRANEPTIGNIGNGSAV